MVTHIDERRVPADLEHSRRQIVEGKGVSAQTTLREPKKHNGFI